MGTRISWEAVSGGECVDFGVGQARTAALLSHILVHRPNYPPGCKFSVSKTGITIHTLTGYEMVCMS